MSSCPVDHRKAVPPTPEVVGAAPVHDASGWRIGRFEEARQVLRNGRATVQAGFFSDHTRPSGDTPGRREMMRPPVLFQDGDEHRRQRSLIGRYFAPKTISRRYSTFLDVRSQEIVERMIEFGECELSDATMRLAVEVAAQVIGLEDADMPGMSARLDAFFSRPPKPPTGTGPLARARHALQMARVSARLARFHRHDVVPAIRRKRATPGDDVISHLLDQGATDPEILTECLTYGAAGMVTTREFISLATWHLCDDAALRTEFVGGDQARRHGVLKEILRLEPIVGHLYRRSTDAVEVGEVEARADERLDLSIRAANLDRDVFGDDSTQIRPGRATPAGVQPEGLAFGDGNHKCPGNHLAIAESDAFLSRLFAHDVELLTTPTVSWNDLITGYEIRDMRVRVTPRGA